MFWVAWDDWGSNVPSLTSWCDEVVVDVVTGGCGLGLSRFILSGVAAATHQNIEKQENDKTIQGEVLRVSNTEGTCEE